MDLSLLIYIIIFLAVIVLIFKVIKKIIFAIFAVIFIIVAVFGGIGAMVYFDYQDLTSQQNFNLNVVYGSLDDAKFGVTVPFENQNPNQDEISTLDVDSIDKASIEDINDSFYVFVEESLFEKLLSEDNQYYLVGTENLDISGSSFDTSLTKSQVLDLVNSNNAQDDYINILLEKNDLGVLADLGGKDLAEQELESRLNGVDFRAALVLSVLSNLDSQGMKALLVGFKEEELMVYPEKFSFKFLRMMPIDTLANALNFEEQDVQVQG